MPLVFLQQMGFLKPSNVLDYNDWFSCDWQIQRANNFNQECAQLILGHFLFCNRSIFEMMPMFKRAWGHLKWTHTHTPTGSESGSAHLVVPFLQKEKDWVGPRGHRHGPFPSISPCWRGPQNSLAESLVTGPLLYGKTTVRPAEIILVLASSSIPWCHHCYGEAHTLLQYCWSWSFHVPSFQMML